MAEALKTLGNEAFKNNDFVKAIEHFTEAIGIDGTNHVLYSNRSAARVRYIEICFLLLLFFFEAFFDRLHLSLSASLLFFFFLFLKRNCEGGACRAFYYVLSLVCACVCACDFFVSLFRALRSPGFKKKMRLEREKRRLLFFSFSSSSLFDRERRARTLLKIDESTDR